MVKFKLHIFKSCQTKHSSPPLEHASSATFISGNQSAPKPSKISNSSINISGPFGFPSLPLPPFYDKKPRGAAKTNNRQVSSEGEVSPEWGSPARLSVFKKMVTCKVEGKVKESFVVVKRSEKPYEDFKKSMMEMIMENQIYEESDLKQLLECFLSLNSWCHHAMIIQAFSEIWNTVFVC